LIFIRLTLPHLLSLFALLNSCS